MHTVADVFCVGCNDRLGWYYVKASDPSQKYKEGKHSAYLSFFHNRCYILKLYIADEHHDIMIGHVSLYHISLSANL